jgi:hypothetical protein
MACPKPPAQRLVEKTSGHDNKALAPLNDSVHSVFPYGL